MANQHSKDFKKLQDKWYRKLKKSGFVDQEQNEKHLKQPSGIASIYRPNGSSRLDDWLEMGITSSIKNHWKTQYYSRARQFLGEYKFKNRLERTIFEMHVEGIGVRAIADKIKKFKRASVHNIIKRLVKVMKNG